ncbi:hypothetical protein SBI_00116 [Streptomyces bingchenggensis BCW-1]|uniref:Uncharacterized protein n=1 Tax=Streptomyces bingchenggensis (strain BCW-1) TaxID=749414 RepID=D7BUP6_STRBB|nr:hypothetical protein SBI_00116 [Streptomyces bingchenggensis BCW-1]
MRSEDELDGAVRVARELGIDVRTDATEAGEG